MASIFLCHNSKDKYFVRKLKDDLKKDGILVWFDEDEMKVGDSLIEKISAGISNMDYLGAILSINSVDSEWVKKEIAIAMSREIEGRKIKVLPILFEKCNIPIFLCDKIYADFTYTYLEGYKALLKVLAPQKNTLPDISETEVDELLKAGEDIYTINELKEKLSSTVTLSFIECEKLKRSIDIFKGNQTVTLGYVSNMSLEVCESLKNHNYPFDELCECYFDHLDKLFQKPFGFGFLDTISDFLRCLLWVVEESSIRAKILRRMRDMGRHFNRYYVVESFADIVANIQNKDDVKIVFDILKDASKEEIDEYLSNVKTQLSIQLLTALKSRKIAAASNF